MSDDRTEICKIISEMLDNPDDLGIYSTDEAYSKLEAYVGRVRAEAIGWMYAEACNTLDLGGDLRLVGVEDIYSRAKVELTAKE